MSHIIIDIIIKNQLMKHYLMWAVIAICTLTLCDFQASAKDKAKGMRMEIVSVEQNDNEFVIYTYKDEDGSENYYLSLGHEFRISEEFGFEILGASLSLVDDASLCLGSTRDEAVEFLNSLVDIFDEDVNYVASFPGRLSTGGGERLGDATTINCVLKKKFIGGKYLQFQFESGKHHATADIGKTTLKRLISFFKKVKK